jgi:RHS repeat-associated protein
MRFESSTSNSAALPYRYNGKELEAMNGLNEYDYGARRRETGIPVWTTVDPLAEKHPEISPYVYCGDNPMNRIDPDGRDWFDKIRKFASGIFHAFSVNTSIGLQAGVKATIGGKGVEAKANLISANLGGLSNGKNTFNIANPSVIQEGTFKIAGAGVSVKKEAKDAGNNTAEKTTSLSASAVVVKAEHTETTTYSQNRDGSYTEVATKEENSVKADDKNIVKGGVSLLVGIEVSFDWNKAAKALKDFIDSNSKK